MARGTLYLITVDPNDMNAVNAECFYGDEAAMQVEYFADRGPEEAERDLEILCDKLRAAKLDVIPIDDGYKLTTYDKANVETCQMAYFEKSLETLKEIVSRLSLKTFATDVTCPYDITQHIQDDYSDALHLDMGTGAATDTLDGFVRRLQPNTAYYISRNAILMH